MLRVAIGLMGSTSCTFYFLDTDFSTTFDEGVMYNKAYVCRIALKRL